MRHIQYYVIGAVFFLFFLAPTDALAASGSGSIFWQNPVNYTTVDGVLTSLLKYLQGIIVLLSIVFLVVGAVLYATSGGRESSVKIAKGAVLASMIGLAVGVASPSLLRKIYDILEAVPSEDAIVDPTAKDYVNTATPVEDIIMNVLNFLLSIVGVISIIMMVVGGLMYLFSGGSENKIETGKKIVVFSIIGLTVALASLILVRQIGLFFQG